MTPAQALALLETAVDSGRLPELAEALAIGLEFEEGMRSRVAASRAWNNYEQAKWAGLGLYDAWRDPIKRRLVLMELEHPTHPAEAPVVRREPVIRPEPPFVPDKRFATVMKPRSVTDTKLDRKSQAAGEREDVDDT